MAPGPMAASTTAAHDEYLESKMRIMLESLVDALLTQQPDQTRDFCLEWLAAWHAEHDPERDEVARLRAERDLLLARKAELLAGSPAAGAAPAGGPPGAVPPEEPDSAEQAKIDRMKDKDRRAGVSATAIDAGKMKDWVKPHFEKPQAARERIKGIVAANEKLQVLFGHLPEASIYDVIDAMRPDSVQAHANLITQGEQGDFFYIVDEGAFDVFVRRGDAAPGKVLECGPGSMFGELALMYNAPRAATVTATADSKVWSLDRESFQMMLATAENTKKSQYEEFLCNIELFKHMTKYEICQLSDLLEPELFDGGEDIMKQGDEGTAFYILEDGEAKAFIKGDEGEIEVKHYAESGAFFGEVALITNAPRRATVRAVGSGCTVLSVSTADFDSVLGPIKEVLEKNIDLYPSYAELVQSLPGAA